MKNIPAALIIEKNKIANSVPWLMLLDIAFPDDSRVYLVNNTENITFQGRTYQAFPFKLENIKQSSKGEIQSVVIRISNVLRSLQAYLEQYDGAVGTGILLRVVHASHLEEDYSELEMHFDVVETTSDSKWVTFTLGAPNPLRNNFPHYKYIGEHCNWLFKSVECGYNGPSETCHRTLTYCRQLGNSKRFGGFPGLSGYGVRLV